MGASTSPIGNTEATVVTLILAGRIRGTHVVHVLEMRAACKQKESDACSTYREGPTKIYCSSAFFELDDFNLFGTFELPGNNPSKDQVGGREHASHSL